MASRKELDDALSQENDEITAAIERHDQQMKDKVTELQDQINNLQSKLDGGDDFGAELAAVHQHTQALQQLAAKPIQAITAPAGTSATGMNTGAAGTTVLGGAGHDAIAAQEGAVLPTDETPHAGSAGSNPAPEPPVDPNAPAPEPEETDKEKKARVKQEKADAADQ